MAICYISERFVDLLKVVESGGRKFKAGLVLGLEIHVFKQHTFASTGNHFTLDSWPRLHTGELYNAPPPSLAFSKSRTLPGSYILSPPKMHICRFHGNLMPLLGTVNTLFPMRSTIVYLPSAPGGSSWVTSHEIHLDAVGKPAPIVSSVASN